MKKIIKRILSLVLIVSVLFANISTAFAATLTINQITTKFSETSIIQGLAQLGMEVTPTVDTQANKIKFMYGDEEVIALDYTNEYLLLDRSDVIVTKDIADKSLVETFVIFGVFQSILELSGYTNKTISSEADLSDGYDTYGMKLVTEEYSFSGEDETGSWTSSGDYIKYLKLSLDTTKIDALMTAYGVDADSEDPNKEIILGLTPSLEATDITSSSVTLKPSIPYTNTDNDYEVFCYIYKSTEEDGEYEKVSDMAINCLGDVSYVDKNLSSNTTYFYKTVVMDGTNFSEPISVTTKKKEVVENPKTGINNPITLISLISLITCLSMFVISKKKAIKQI